MQYLILAQMKSLILTKIQFTCPCVTTDKIIYYWTLEHYLYEIARFLQTKTLLSHTQHYFIIRPESNYVYGPGYADLQYIIRYLHCIYIFYIHIHEYIYIYIVNTNT